MVVQFVACENCVCVCISSYVFCVILEDLKLTGFKLGSEKHMDPFVGMVIVLLILNPLLKPIGSMEWYIYQNYLHVPWNINYSVIGKHTIWG